jgi:hypothetical protein
MWAVRGRALSWGDWRSPARGESDGEINGADGERLGERLPAVDLTHDGRRAVRKTLHAILSSLPAELNERNWRIPECQLFRDPLCDIEESASSCALTAIAVARLVLE